MLWSLPASTTGARFEPPPPPLGEYSRWSRGAPRARPSKARAVRWPVPVMIRARALPGAQPVRPTTSWTTADRSVVRWLVPASPMVAQAAGFQVAAALVRVRVEILFAEE